MQTELATIMVIEIGIVAFFFLLLPLAITVAKLPAVWRSSRGTGLLLSGVIVLTGFFFILFFVGLAALTFGKG